MGHELKIFDTAQLAAEACGQAIFDVAADARKLRGVAAIAVSGGSTPRIMFEWMAQQKFDWSDVHLFWVDERCVPPDNEQSNYRMTRLALLETIGLPATQVHRIQGEIDPAAAAAQYAEEIAKVIPDAVFDVIQRGMGNDGHTASLFPGEPMVDDLTGVTAALWVEKMKQHRVTLKRGVLEQARLTLNLVTGADKAAPLLQVLKGPRDLHSYPAQISSPEMVWYLDPAAAEPLHD